MGTIREPAALYRFNGLDATAAAVYLAFTAFFALASDLLEPLLRPLFPHPAAESYAVNLMFYACVGVFAIASARHVVARDVRILGTRPWFTAAMVPASLVTMLVFTVILVAATGSVQSSENQQDIQGLMQQVPPWLMVPLLVVLGPFVEEYLFRHLLIGKLSRHVHIWICCALSALLFASIHVMGREGLVLSAVAPYLGMGIVLVAVYVWTGRNLMFSYLVHASKNLLAVILIYAIPPEFMEQMQQFQP